jgi:hypothetical protein
MRPRLHRYCARMVGSVIVTSHDVDHELTRQCGDAEDVEICIGPATHSDLTKRSLGHRLRWG